MANEAFGRLQEHVMRRFRSLPKINYQKVKYRPKYVGDEFPSMTEYFHEDDPLTRKQWKFVEHFAVHDDVRAAAKHAGYLSNGANLMDQPNIQKQIRSRREMIAEAIGLSGEMVMGEMMRIAFANATDFISFTSSELTLTDLETLKADPTTAPYLPAISEISLVTTKDGPQVKLRFHNKLEALKALADFLNLTGPIQKDPNIIETEEDKLNGLQSRSTEILSRLARIATAASAGGVPEQLDSGGAEPTSA